MLRPIAESHAAAEATRVGVPYEPAGIPASLASVDSMVEEAKRRWSARDMAGEVGFLFINHVGDKNAYVSIYRAGTDRVTLTGEGIHFDGPTGRVVHEDPPYHAATATHNFISGALAAVSVRLRRVLIAHIELGSPGRGDLAAAIDPRLPSRPTGICEYLLRARF